jgi:ATP-binding cassette, subfamily F, member 3
MISVENISKGFGGQVLFEDASFRLNAKERAGLVGRNGHGKTTLLKMLVGEEKPDSGNIIIPKQYRLGHVRQHIDFSEDTVLKEGMKGLLESEKDHHWKVEKILAGLGFSETDMDRNPCEFSGGYQVRLNLAKILVSEPDLLLLDEPTNYLDITSIRWIERFLRGWPRELLLITHDRGFMDKVITHTIAIHRKKIRKIEGDTGKLYEQIAQDEEIYEKTRANDERRRKEIEQFITRFRAKARLANLVQSRVKTLEKMEKRDKLETLKDLDFSFRSKPFRGKQMLAVKDLAFSYDGGKPLIENLNFTVAPGECIGVVGKNGKGKTTLLKLLSGSLQPDTGEIAYNPRTEVGIYEQTNIKTLVDQRSVEEEILYSAARVDRQVARNICGAMMFEGDGALKKVAVLSGGEKSRVMLGKLLAAPLNMILLDEPTNHLDMESNDALLAAIDAFDGAVIMVTHNEMFLHALAERLIVFDDDGVSLFEGGYGRFLEKGGWQDEDTPKGSGTTEDREAPTGPTLSKKELRRRRSEILAERGKAVKPVEKKIAEAENIIDACEKELARLNEAMQAAAEQQDGDRIKELSRAIHTCQSAIEERFAELEEMSEIIEEKGKVFDQKLAELDAAAEY